MVSICVEIGMCMFLQSVQRWLPDIVFLKKSISVLVAITFSHLKLPIVVYNILPFVHTIEKILVYLHFRHVCSVFRPTAWTVYASTEICLCSICHQKQINNCTERPDNAGPSPPTVLCCGAVCQE